MSKNTQMNYILTQYYLRSLLTQDESERRTQIVRNLEKIVNTYKSSQLEVIGSSAYSLTTLAGDIDVVCLTNTIKENEENVAQTTVLMDLCGKFQGSEFIVENTLLNATFPIIKLRHKASNLRIDMSVNQFRAIENTALIRNILSAYPAMKQVIVLSKTICGMFEINSSYTCTLSSYSITLMVIFYFQMINEIPRVFSCTKTLMYKEFNLYENLKGFFFYYGWMFNYSSDVVSVRIGRPMKKNRASFRIYNPKYSLIFCIEDPFLIDFNVTRTVNETSLVQIIKTFRMVHYMLSKHDLSLFK